MAKRSCDPRIAYPEVKVQVRDPMRVVGIVGPFAHVGSVFGKIRFLEGVKGMRRLVPGAPAAVPHGRAKHSPGLCGDCRMVQGYRARGVSIRGKFVSSKNTKYKTKDGVAMLINVVLTPG